jgi:hypothetical protein
MVCPLGGNYKTDQASHLCQDLKLVWTSNFRLLGIDIDSKLEKMTSNYDTKFLVVEDLILKLKKRLLTTMGRISIAKALLLSQYIYCFSCIDISDDMVRRYSEGIQDHWCDLMDKELGIDKHARRKILRMGDLSFQGIIGKTLQELAMIILIGLVPLLGTQVVMLYMEQADQGRS